MSEVERLYNMDNWYPKLDIISALCEEAGISNLDAYNYLMKPWEDEGKHYNWMHDAIEEEIASWIIDGLT